MFYVLCRLVFLESSIAILSISSFFFKQKPKTSSHWITHSNMSSSQHNSDKTRVISHLLSKFSSSVKMTDTFTISDVVRFYDSSDQVFDSQIVTTSFADRSALEKI